MNTASKCPQCGSDLPQGALAGFCPTCLLMQGAKDSEPQAATFTPPTPSELAPLFPQLEIIELIGKGGMGVVYKVRQKSLNRFVALKLLVPERVGDAGFTERFQKEAQALAALNHPNIVTIHDFGQAGGFYFLLMEFVDGMNLRQLLHASRIAPREALAIVPQICDALQYAHDAGIVHRDIKPENILLDRQGRVKVADFGLVKLMGTVEPTANGTVAPPSATTEAGQVMGTPQYMAPEQREHPTDVDHRADIYSLGVVFYQMLTGELPGKPLEPPSHKVQIDVRLDAVVLRALEKKPELRYQQVSDVKTMVETIVTTPPQIPSLGKAGPADFQPSLARQAALGSQPLEKTASSSRVLNVGNCRITTFERLATFGEQFFFYRNKGRLILDEHQLTFSGFGMHTVIPLAAISDLSIGRLPRVMHPAGLHFISVTYKGGGQSKRIILSPYEGLFGLPSQYNQLVAHWFDAIRAAVTSATGHAPARTPAEKLGTPSSSVGIVMLFSSLVLVCIIVSIVINFLALHNTGPLPQKMQPQPPMPMMLTPAAALPEIKSEVVIKQPKQSASSDSAEIWSPALAPDEKPDLQKICNEADSLMNQGRYEESLQRHIWYFNHALENGEVNPVRLSFGVAGWGELARRYPKARQALIEVRDRDAQTFAKGSGYSDLFAEVANINRELHDDAATVALFKSIQTDPALAKQCYFFIEDLLVSKGEYALCLSCFGNPQARFQAIRTGRDMEKKIDPAGEADNRFVANTCQLIEILVGAGRKTEAEKIRDAAVALLDDARLKSAVSGAEEKIRPLRQNETSKPLAPPGNR